MRWCAGSAQNDAHGGTHLQRDSDVSAVARMMPDALAEEFPSLRTVLVFIVLATAAASISETLRKAVNLPLVTGYILAGVICGPHLLALLSSTETKQLARIVNDDAMGFIGFSAGSKFLLSELQGSLRLFLTLLAGLVCVTYCFVFTGFFFASPWLSLTASQPNDVLPVCLFIACLAVARSPSSAIAVVTELNAYGPFTTAALSVVILMDVVVVLLFALTVLMVRVVAPTPGKDSAPVGLVLGLFAFQIAISVVLGAALGGLLHGFITCTDAGVTVTSREAASDETTSSFSSAAAATAAMKPSMASRTAPVRESTARL